MMVMESFNNHTPLIAKLGQYVANIFACHLFSNFCEFRFMYKFY